MLKIIKYLTTNLFLLLIGVTFLQINAAQCENKKVTTSEVELPFDLYKYDPSELIIKKVSKFAELDFGSNFRPRGQLVQLVYKITTGTAPLEVVENYKQSFAAQSFNVIKESKNNFRVESTNDDGRILLLKRTEANGDSYIHLESFTISDKLNTKRPVNYFSEIAKLSPSEVIVMVQVIAPKAIENNMVKENVSYILQQLKDTGRVQLYGIYFDTNQTTIKAESDDVISEVSKALQQESGLSLRVIGHTDNVGEIQDNQILSEGRAKAVVASMIAKGIVAERLVAEGKGEGDPIASNETDEGKAKNRRVELIKIS